MEVQKFYLGGRKLQQIKLELNRLIHGDCLEILPTMPDKFVDLTITSPPYNIVNHSTRGFKHNPYKDNLPEEEYQAQQIKVLDELYRITKDTGSLMYNHKNRIIDQLSVTPYRWIEKSKWLVKQEIVWMNHSPNFAKVRFFPFTERVY